MKNKKAEFKKKEQEISMTIDLSVSQSSISGLKESSLNSSLYNSVENSDKSVELISKDDIDPTMFEDPDEVAKRELRCPKFWLLFYVSITKFVLVYYMVDMNKILGL